MNATPHAVPTAGPASSRNRLLAGLPADLFGLMRADLKPTVFAHGAVIWAAGAEMDAVYFPESAAIALQVSLKDGAQFATALVGPEGAIGPGMRRSPAETVVFTRGTLSVMRRERFERLAEQHAPLRALAVAATESLLAQAQHISVCRVAHDGSARLARWLLKMSDCAADNAVALTQEALGKFVGVRRTSITLYARELQDRGAIRYRRGRIVIHDRGELEHCACECHAALSAYESDATGAGAAG